MAAKSLLTTITTSVLALTTAQAQSTFRYNPPEADLQILSKPYTRKDGTDVSIDRIKNLYKSPLVALSATTSCGDSKGSLDAALIYAEAILPGGEKNIAPLGTKCISRVTAAIFADGRVDGDEGAIKKLLYMRGLVADSIGRLLEQLYKNFQERGVIDIAAVQKSLEDRQKALPSDWKDEHDKYWAEYEFLWGALFQLHELEALEKEPNYADYQKEFMMILRDWREALTSQTYPSTFRRLPIPPSKPRGAK